MEFPAKELRLVILGLKKLLAASQQKLAGLGSDSDEFAFEANDAALIELMINRLEEEYHRKHAVKNS
jgi:hypothetical protein